MRPRVFASVAVLFLAAAAAHAARGGPDARNWRWADSAEPGVSLAGENYISYTTFAPAWADEEIQTVSLSFPFTLYGVTSSTLWVSSNGWVSLANPLGATAPVNLGLPDPAAPNAAIAWWWDDLWGGTSSFGMEGPTANGHRLDLRLEDKRSGEMVQAALQFYRNGSLKVIYTILPTSRTASVGIEDDAGAVGTQIARDATSAPGVQLAGDYAILYYPASAPGCAAAVPATCGSAISGSTAGAFNRAASYACAAGAWNGADQVHRLTLPSMQSFSATLSGRPGAALFLLRSGCDGYLDCLAGGGTTLALPFLSAGDYYLVVDGPGASSDGAYSIATSCTPASTPIACGGTVSATPSGASGIGSYSCWFGTYDGPEKVYEFSLAAPQHVSASLGAAAPYELFLADAASLATGASACLRAGDQGVAAFDLPAGSYALVVDGGAASSGAFSLSLDCRSQLPSTPVTCGQTGVPATNLGPSYLENYPSCGAAGYTMGEALFRFSAGSRVLASFEALRWVDYDVLAFPAGGLPGSCLGMADQRLTLANMTPGDYTIALESASAAGVTELSVTCQPMDATPLGCGATLAGRTPPGPGMLDNYSCLIGALDGSESFYVVNNPVTQNLSVGVWGSPAGQEVDVAIFGPVPFDPGAPACLAGGLNVATVANAAPGEYLVVVDGENGAADVPHSLAAACGPSPLACTGALDLACNSLVAGNTAAGAAGAYLYGNVDALFTGKEQVYHFFNPVKQNVNFLLRNASDPRLDLILLRGCDSSAMVDWGDEALIEPSLDPGDYYLVVDGREGVEGSFELVTFCGGAVLDPQVLRSTLAAGQCLTEHKKLYFPTSVPAADLVFSFDLSGSMGQELDQVKQNARQIYGELNRLIPSLRFGLASFVEYDVCYTDTVCFVDGYCPPAAGAFPFKMDQPLTSDIAQVDTVLQTIRLVGGAKETYTRTFHEAYANPIVGWRSCARRLWLNIGDELPVDCNAYACTGGSLNTGRDPGPDLLTGTPDDLELLPTIDRMASNGITLIAVDSSESAPQIALWDCLARRTGGTVFVTDGNGRIPGGTDIVRGLVDVIKDTLRPCPEVRLVPTGPYAAWVSITPAAYGPLKTPFYGEFDLTFCVPPGTPSGLYPIAVEARCLGAGSCTSELLGTQSVELSVTDPCLPGPTAIPSAQPAAICAGASTVLDGSASGSCGPAPLEYRWSEGAAVRCDWSSSPLCAVTPAASTTYTLEVRCAGLPCSASAPLSVSVVPLPSPALAPIAPVCAGGAVTLDAGASSPNGCPLPLEYQFRDAAGVIRPWSPAAGFGPFLPAASALYTVEVRCPQAPGCAASASTPLEVLPPPAALAGADVDVCEGAGVTLDGSGSGTGSCLGGVLYEWREGALVVSPAGPSPLWSPPTAAPGNRTYTLLVSCAQPAGCEDRDDVVVNVRSCPLSVEFGAWHARRLAGNRIAVEWSTLAESGTLGFLVERAADAAGPFHDAGGWIDARGAHSSYRFEDAAAPASPWYRIVEITLTGARGDRTPAFSLASATRGGSRSRGSSGRR